MEKQIILITGTSSGFGKLTAYKLAQDGHRVFAGLRSKSPSYALAISGHEKFASQNGVDLKTVDIDVTDTDSVNKAVDSIVKSAGRIDVIINNAGAGTWGITEAYTVEQAKALFDLNVFSMIRTARAAIPQFMKQGGGTFICISSGLGRLSMPFTSIYNASKYAVEGLIESYSLELAPLKINFHIIEPGAYPTTNFMKNSVLPADSARVDKYGDYAKTPDLIAKGLIEHFSGANAPDPQDVADAVSALLSMPGEKRPLRTVVDKNLEFGKLVENINETCAKSQSLMNKAFGR